MIFIAERLFLVVNRGLPCVNRDGDGVSPSLKRPMRGGKAGDRDAERRAGNVIEADLVAELNGNGVAAVQKTLAENA